MSGYADIICIKIFLGFILKIFEIGYKSFELLYEIFQIAFQNTSSSDVLSVFEITRSVFFVLQFTIKSISVILVLT